jgi:hypothetical protein
VGDDRWADFLEGIVRRFETGTFLTVFEVPGKVGRLPNALGGDPARRSLIAAPATGKKGLYELLAAKAHFLMLPKRIVAIMNTTRVRFREHAVSQDAEGETYEQDYPRLAEIQIPGAGDALAKAGWDLGRADTAPDPHDSYGILETLYHELTHAWIWLQEFYAAEIGDLYAAGLADYKEAKGAGGTTFEAHRAFTEAAAYYVGGRVRRWCTALQELDRVMRNPMRVAGEVDYIAKSYDEFVWSKGRVSVGDTTVAIESPALSDKLREAIDDKILEGRPLTKPFAQTPLNDLRAMLSPP